MKTPVGQQFEEAMICPITGEIMTDPVIDPEGNSYEKSAILDWLSRQASSPITRNALHPHQLTPNRMLRDLLDIHHEEERKKSEMTNLCSLAGSQAGPNFDVTLATSYDSQKHIGLVQVSVTDNETQLHKASEVVCVIDVSYSMDSPAKMHGDPEGSAGLSLLDIVKHATVTVVETMGPGDKLAVVAYASSARIVLPFTKMTKDGKEKAKTAVNNLRTCGNTNIWDGLSKAMDLVQNEPLTHNANILLLTDGLPNIHPPRGELPTLIRYKEAHPDMNCRISTFGFGYNLDSQLLNDIAAEGGGQYGFIPDSSFVGTIFINAASNILSTAIPECQLLLEASAPGVAIESCLNLGRGATPTSWGMSISLPGGLRYGQTFDVLVQIKDERTTGRETKPFVGTLQFQTVQKDVTIEERSTGGEPFMTSTINVPLEVALLRSRLVNLIRSNLGSGPSLAKYNARFLLEEMRSSGLSGIDSRAGALQEDLEGQITEAYSRADWFNKWGRHYLPSLARAHELQQCSNFKDPGVQVYSTKKFALIRDRAEELFCKLPPPKPSLARDDIHGKKVRKVQNMRAYHNSHGPCFAAGEVRLADGRFVSVTEIVAGDEIATTAGGRPARVKCVVATACEMGMAQLVELQGGVLVTPWHPVRPKGDDEWQFPSDLAPTSSYACEKVYSFVLEDGATGAMQIGPYEVVTLGHGFQDGIAKHDYLGTGSVIDDLSGMIGWQEGRVELGPNPAVRDSETGLIVAFRQEGTDSSAI